MWKLIYLITSMDGEIVYLKDIVGTYPAIAECINNVGVVRPVDPKELKSIPYDSKIIYRCEK